MIKVSSDADRIVVAKLQEIGQDHVFAFWDELPPEHLLVSIDEDGPSGRILTLVPRGERYRELARHLTPRGR